MLICKLRPMLVWTIDAGNRLGSETFWRRKAIFFEKSLNPGLFAISEESLATELAVWMNSTYFCLSSCSFLSFRTDLMQNLRNTRCFILFAKSARETFSGSSFQHMPLYLQHHQRDFHPGFPNIIKSSYAASYSSSSSESFWSVFCSQSSTSDSNFWSFCVSSCTVCCLSIAGVPTAEVKWAKSSPASSVGVTSELLILFFDWLFWLFFETSFYCNQ